MYNVPPTVGAAPNPLSRGVNYGNQYFEARYAPFAVVQANPGKTREATEQIIAEETDKGVEAAKQIRDQILAETESIREAMYKKYGVEF